MKRTDRPNVILINCDDLGWGDPGCCGSTRNATPHLDRLAAGGTRFTDFCATSALCTPSRGGLLTGCYPPRIGFDAFDSGHVLFPGDAEGLAPDEQTIASLLRDRGYATQLVGKWHCGDQPAFLPTRHGFDGYLGIPYSNDMGRQRGRHAPGGRTWPPLPMLEGEEVIEQQFDMASVTQRYTEEACRFVRENQERPFFLYLAHMYVHLPLIVPEHLLARSTNGRYGAAVAAIDWSTGRILHLLETLGLAEDTLILFTSDNGSRARGEGGSNGELRGHKGQSWEGGFRVPLLARWPGRVPAGRVSGGLFAMPDLLPTLTNLAGAATPKLPIDGVNQTDLLLGRSESGKRETFGYFMGPHLVAIRDDRHKLFLAREGEGDKPEPVTELYDLREDPGEQRNLADERPEAVARLRDDLDRLAARLGPDGPEKRPCGRVDNPVPLTEYDPDHPYFAAEYDLADAG